MPYYIRPIPNASDVDIWHIENDVAKKVGYENPEDVPGAQFTAKPGETIWDAFKAATPWFEPNGENPFHKSQLGPGQYYPRMARPFVHSMEPPGRYPGVDLETNSIAIYYSQLIVLAQELSRICQTVHPTTETFETFGHDIRNLLILACTEVEAHWRGVLTANGVQKARLTTADYVRLAPAMRLDEYAVVFPSYPWLQATEPFRIWGHTGSPTKELTWYDSYNAVKHDRESAFGRATLRSVFEAVSACYVMMIAQFGPPHKARPGSEPLLFFRLSSSPNWPLSEGYMGTYSDKVKTTAINYPF